MEGKLVVAVNNENFKQEIIESSLPVLVDFWAEWCGPCRMIAPVIEELANEYKDRLKVCKINVDSSPQLASNYDVMSIPTLMVFKNGERLDTLVGAVGKNELVSRLNKHLM